MPKQLMGRAVPALLRSPSLVRGRIEQLDHTTKMPIRTSISHVTLQLFCLAMRQVQGNESHSRL